METQCTTQASTGELHGRTVCYGTATTPDELYTCAEQGTYHLEYHSTPEETTVCEWCGNTVSIFYSVTPNQPGEPTVAYCAAETEKVFNRHKYMHLAPCIEMHCNLAHTEHAMSEPGCVWANQQY